MVFSWLTWFLMESERSEKQSNCLVDCSMRHIPPLFIGVIVKSLFTVFLLWKIMLDMFWHKKSDSLQDFERISFWWCLELLFFFARHPTSPVWKDIQMLKFGQIVDLDLIERSAPNKYVQVRRRRVSLSGWDEGVKVSSWSQPVGVVLPGVWWVVDWYQCILDCGLIKGSGFVVATQRHKKKGSFPSLDFSLNLGRPWFHINTERKPI